tara:strand:- start:115 stop:555 length:441 start_codon:yes stop_codon:yes gene_type:complete
MKKIYKENKYTLEKIIPSKIQIKTLYDILKLRQHSISHQSLPTYKKHIFFVKNNPYDKWFIVYEDSTAIGSFYIKKDNSIGLNFTNETHKVILLVVRFIKKNFIPIKSKASLIPPYFYINVPYSNIKLKNILIKLKLIPIQISLKL